MSLIDLETAPTGRSYFGMARPLAAVLLIGAVMLAGLACGGPGGPAPRGVTGKLDGAVTLIPLGVQEVAVWDIEAFRKGEAPEEVFESVVDEFVTAEEVDEDNPFSIDDVKTFAVASSERGERGMSGSEIRVAQLGSRFDETREALLESMKEQEISGETLELAEKEGYEAVDFGPFTVGLVKKGGYLTAGRTELVEGGLRSLSGDSSSLLESDDDPIGGVLKRGGDGWYASATTECDYGTGCQAYALVVSGASEPKENTCTPKPECSPEFWLTLTQVFGFTNEEDAAAFKDEVNQVLYEETNEKSIWYVPTLQDLDGNFVIAAGTADGDDWWRDKIFGEFGRYP